MATDFWWMVENSEGLVVFQADVPYSCHRQLV